MGHATRSLLSGAVLIALAAPVVASAGWPMGSRIDGSMLVDVTPAGFATIETLASTFIPPSIPIAATTVAGDDCTDLGWLGTWCTYEYAIDVSAIDVSVGIDSLALTPGEQVLNLDGVIGVQAASAASPATLAIDATIVGFIDISDTCNLYTDPIDITITGAVQMTLVDDPFGVDVDGDSYPDTKKLDAYVAPIDWTWNASDSLHLDNCATADVISALDWLGIDVYGMILDQVEPEVAAIVNDLPADLEPTIEDAFASTTISQQLDLAGVPLGFTIWPETLELKTEGLRLGMSSVTTAPVSPCVAQWDPGESVSTLSTEPAIGEAGGSVPFAPHAAAFIDDDFLNQVLYGVWAGGLLCYNLDSAGAADLGVPLGIDTTLLAILAPNVYTTMFPTTKPMEIRTAPRLPPVVAEGTHQVNIEADDLGLGFLVELDGRKTRLFNVDLVARVGVDTTFDGTTGNLGVLVDATDIVPTVDYNEFKPDESATIEGSFNGLLQGLVGSLLGDALGALAFPIPGFEGIGVTDLVAGPGGPDGDYVGAWLTAGSVSYASTGCDAESGGCSGEGCDTSGCSSGCNSGGGRVIVLSIPLVAAFLRRRR